MSAFSIPNLLLGICWVSGAQVLSQIFLCVGLQAKLEGA
jgi:hypothetical protein